MSKDEKQAVGRPHNLKWSKHLRGGKLHTEWYSPCGCSFHPEPSPHVHPCSTKHDRCHEVRLDERKGCRDEVKLEMRRLGNNEKGCCRYTADMIAKAIMERE